MRFHPMHLLRHWHQYGSHAHHHAKHGHWGHGHGLHGGGYGSDGERFAELLERVSARLDLTSAQQELLNELLTQLQRQRRAMRAAAAGSELRDLIASENFDRASAQQLFDARMDSLRAGGPALVAAFGDFFDALDFEQQQALRFVLRAGARC